MIYRSPAAALAPFVDALWFYESAHEHARELVLPNGRSQLLVNLDTGCAFVTGPFTKPRAIAPAQMRRMVGVVFRPEGSFSITGVSALELQNGTERLDTLLPLGGADLAPQLAEALTPERMLARAEAWLLERRAEPTPELAAVAAAVRALEAGHSVAAAVDHTGMSRSSLLRRFTTHVGATPKQFARLHRFQRCVHALAGGAVDLAQLALDVGYSDQAHFCHEFRELAGRSPTEYRPRNAREPNHVVD